MPKIVYTVKTATRSRVLLGDCRKILERFPSNTFTAIVTDPPYGLEFMGKEWDKLDGYSGGNPNIKPQGKHTRARGEGWQPGSSYGMPKRNPRCRRCGKLQRGNGCCKCKQPNLDHRYGEQGFRMQAWHEAWAEAALRVLKPGGMLLAFGGTRTHHRLMCAIEDAGFEIRDCLMWLYGSGFPKSANISKNIDKAAGMEREVVGSKITGNAKQRTNQTGPATEAAKLWDGYGTALKPAYEPVLLCTKPLTAELLFGILVEDITNTMQEVLQCCGSSVGDAEKSFSVIQVRLERAQVSTVPGLAKTNALASIENARYVASVFTSSYPDSCESTKTKGNFVRSSAKESGKPGTVPERLTPAGEADNILTQLRDIVMSVVEGDTVANIVSSWKSTSVELLNQLNRFTTKTVINLTTELRTLRSCLLPTISTATGNLRPNFEPIIVAMKPLDGTFAQNAQKHGVAGLNIDGSRIGSEEMKVTKSDSMAGQNTGRVDCGTKQGRWPANLLLQHTSDAPCPACEGDYPMCKLCGGTGVIQGCVRKGTKKVKSGVAGKKSRAWGIGEGKISGGNWEAHGSESYADADGLESVEDWICCSDCPVYLLDEHSGASRFFKVFPPETVRFCYAAKASKKERTMGGQVECTHPTVKPLSLMGYLVMLVTMPEHNFILDPFCGSGSTLIACKRLGLKYVGIDSDPESIRVATERLEHA